MKRRHLLGYSLLFLAGCSASKVREVSKSNVSGKRPERLRLAVTDVQGLEDLEADYGPFRNVLEEVLELPIEFFPVENFVAAAPALLAGNVDLVFAGPSEYLILQARADAQPVIAVTRPDYYTVIAVKTDSNINALEDLKGKTLGMRAEGSTAAHIGAMKLLLDADLSPNKDFRTAAVGNDTLSALLNDDIDAWSSSNSRHTRVLQEAGVDDQVRIIAKGERLPNDVFVVRKTLDPQFIKDIQQRMKDNQNQLLKAMASTVANAKYQESTFIPASDDQYEELRQVYRAIGQESLIQ